MIIREIIGSCYDIHTKNTKYMKNADFHDLIQVVQYELVDTVCYNCN